jgi:hypothetical protein
VTAAVDLWGAEDSAVAAGGCQHLGPILHDIQQAIGPTTRSDIERMTPPERESFVTAVARRNVLRTTELMLQSETIRGLVSAGAIAIVGALYDVVSGKIEFVEVRAQG